MKRLSLYVLVLSSIIALPISSSYAAVQNVAGDTAINASGIADGCSFSADATLSVPAATAVNTNALADGIVNAVGSANKGTVTFAGASATLGNLGAAAGTALKQINVAAGAITTSGNIFSQGITFTGDGSLAVATTKNVTSTITTNATNTGTLTLAGTHTVTGDIGASGAVLKQINANGAGTTAAFTGNIFATTLNFGGNGTATIADTKNLNAAVTTSVNNTGTLNFLGATATGGNIGVIGTALTAVNFNGATTLNNNIAATTTTINAGSTVTLSGNRTVTGNLTVANAATSALDIGTSTLTLGGTGIYTQSNAASKLKVTVNGATGGQIAALGNAAVSGGILEVNVAGFVPNGTAYKVIDGAAGGAIAGNTITDNSAVLTFAGAVAAGDLTITATRTNTYNSIASGNAGAAGVVLENLGAAATGDMRTVLNTLDNMSSTTEIAAALQTVVPIVDGGVVATSTSAINQFVGTSMGRLENMLTAPGGALGSSGVSTGDDYMKGLEIWGQGFGNYTHQDKRGTSNGYNASVYGTALGGDIPVYSDAFRMGLSGGFAQSFVRSKDNSGRTDISSYQGTLYGGYQDDNYPYYIDGAFSFAYNTYDGSRHVAVGTIDRTANADYDGEQYSVLVGGGYTLTFDKMRFTPLASIQYMRLHVAGYTETDASALNLIVDGQNYDMVQSGLGAKLDYPMETKYGTFIPEVHFKWLYDFIGDKQETTSTFSGGGGSFKTDGFGPEKSSFDIGTKFSLITKKNFIINANYDFEVKEDYWAHTGWLEVRYKI